jgi:outer membrane protein assembly factor BamB
MFRAFMSVVMPLMAAAAATVALVAAGDRPSVAVDAAPAEDGKASVLTECAMFGCTVSRNMANVVDKSIPAEWSVQEGQTKNLKWSAKLGTKAYGGPVIAGGKVFVSTNNARPRNPAVKASGAVLMCFRESDGKFLWQAFHEELPSDIVKDARGEGLASTPAIEGNRLYYVNNRCEVICADTEGNPDKGEAKILWKFDMMKELGVFPHKLPNCSPLVAGDLLFVTTGNGVDEEEVKNPKAPSFIAVDKKTGTIRWQNNSPGSAVVLGQWSNPAYAVVNGKAQVIFGGGDGWLRGFEAETGKPLWKFDCNPKSAKIKHGPSADRNYLVATPVVHDNKVYVGLGQEPSLGSGVSHFWCVDITKTGDISPVDDNFDPKADVNGKSGLVWHYGGLNDAKKADETGRKYGFGRTVSTCAIHDGLVYIAELDGYLHCLDAKTGEKYWEHDLKAEIWGSPYYVDGKVYLGTGDSEVHVFAHGKTKKALGKVDVEDALYTTPAAANGVLYLATMKKLYAVTNK